MEKMDLNFIHLFARLDALAERHSISTVEWANAAKVAQPRITELRNAYKLYKINAPVSAGKSCSFGRILELLIGLRAILGNKKVDEELLKEARAEKDKAKRLMLMSMVVTTAAEHHQDTVIEKLDKFIEHIIAE